MEEHIALKHRLVPPEADNDKENQMDNRSLRSLLLKTPRKPTGDSSVNSYSSIVQRGRSSSIKASEIYKSEFRDSTVGNMKPAQSACNADELKTPLPLPRARPSTRNANTYVAKKQSSTRQASQSNRVNGFASYATKNRRMAGADEQRRKVPSVFEMV